VYTCVIDASRVVHCCAIKKNVIVASQLYNSAVVEFTVEWEEYHYQTVDSA